MAVCISLADLACAGDGTWTATVSVTDGVAIDTFPGQAASVARCSPFCGSVVVPSGGTVCPAGGVFDVCEDPAFTDCPPGDGRYSCAGGVCTPTTGGTYADLAACEAAGCGTTCSGKVYADSGCCPGVCWPSTLMLTVSGACAGLNGTYSLTWNGFVWVSAPVSYNGHFVNWQVGCDGSPGGMSLALTDSTVGGPIMTGTSPNPDCATPSFSSADAGATTTPVSGGPCDGLTPDWVVSA